MTNPTLLLALLSSVVLATALVLALRVLGRTRRELRDAEATFRQAVEAMQEGIVVREADGRLVIANSQGREILGLTPEQLMGDEPIPEGWAAYHEDGTPWPQHEWPSHAALQEGQPQRDRVMMLRMPWGETIWLSITAVPLYRDGEDTPFRVVTPFSDVTVRKRREDRTRRQIERANDVNAALEREKARLNDLAHTDGLTGLRNRRALQEGLKAEMARCRAVGSPLALIVLDVDEFKSYNDAFGHPAGDEALRAVANILHGAARGTDLVARHGGEEFAIVLPETDERGALVLAERLRAAIEAAPWELRPVTASLGVAMLHPDDDPERLVAEADAALYRSKRAGRNRVSHANGDERGTFLLA